MTSIQKNVAGQSIVLSASSIVDGSPITTGATARVSSDGGNTFAAGSGTLQHKENGKWRYLPTQAETNGDHLVFYLDATDINPNNALNVYTTSLDPHNTSSGGLTNLDAAVSTRATAMNVRTELENIHLHRLLANQYDAASPPGLATSLFRQMTEYDGSSAARYTVPALSQGPTGVTGGVLVVDASGHVTLADGAHGGTSAVIEANINGAIQSVIKQLFVETAQNTMLAGTVTSDQQAPTATVVDVNFAASGGASAEADNYRGRDLLITGGGLKDQRQQIKSSTQVTADIARLTLEDPGFTSAPSNGDGAQLV